jgi:hypothetical protein
MPAKGSATPTPKTMLTRQVWQHLRCPNAPTGNTQHEALLTDTHHPVAPVQGIDVHLTVLAAPGRPRQRMAAHTPQPVVLHHLPARVVAQVRRQDASQVLQHCQQGVLQGRQRPLQEDAITHHACRVLIPACEQQHKQCTVNTTQT